MTQEVNQILNWRAEGMTIDAISAVSGLSFDAVVRILHSNINALKTLQEAQIRAIFG